MFRYFLIYDFDLTFLAYDKNGVLLSDMNILLSQVDTPYVFLLDKTEITEMANKLCVYCWEGKLPEILKILQMPIACSIINLHNPRGIYINWCDSWSMRIIIIIFKKEGEINIYINILSTHLFKVNTHYIVLQEMVILLLYWHWLIFLLVISIMLPLILDPQLYMVRKK